MASEDEDDLAALRNAVLATMKNPPKVVKSAEEESIQIENRGVCKRVHSLPYQDLNVHPLLSQQPYDNASLPATKQEWRPKFSGGQYRGHKGFGNRGKWIGNQNRGRTRGGFSNNRSSNLILIPLAGEESEEPRKQGMQEKEVSSDSKPLMLRPQDKWAGASDDNVSGSSTPTHQSRSAAPGRFRRFDSDSDSEEDDSDNETEENNFSPKNKVSSDEEFQDMSKDKGIGSDDSDSESSNSADVADSHDSKVGSKSIENSKSVSEKPESVTKQSEEIKGSEPESENINEPSSSSDSDKENSDKSSENKPQLDDEVVVKLNVSRDHLNCVEKNNNDSEESKSSHSESDDEFSARKISRNRRGSDSSSSHSIKLSPSIHSSCSVSKNKFISHDSISSCDLDRNQKVLPQPPHQSLLPTNAHENKMMEARRKKFQTSSEVSVSDSRKTISLKGIVPRTKNKKQNKKIVDKPLIKLSNKRTRRSPFRSESSTKHEKPKLKDEVKTSRSKIKTVDRKGSEIKSERKVSIESKESKSASSSSELSDFEESDSDSNTWRTKTRVGTGRHPEDIERERRRRIPQKITDDVIINRNTRQFYTQKTSPDERHSCSHKTYKRKQFFEEEPEEITSSKTRRGLSSVVRSDTDSRKKIDDYKSKRVKVCASRDLGSRLGVKTEKNHIIVEEGEVGEEHEEPLILARTDARYLIDTHKDSDGRCSPSVTLSYDSDDITATEDDPKRSVHQRLGMQIKTYVQVLQKKNKSEDSEEYSSKTKRKHKKNMKEVTDDLLESGGSHENDLDRRIRTIQDRNAAILKRQKEVQQDKKQFG